MKSAKNYLIAFLALATAGSSFVAWRQYQELVALRAAGLNPAERTEWQQRVWAAEKRRSDLEKQVATPAAPEEPIDEPAAARNSQESSGVRAGGRGGGRNRFAAMMDQPEVQRLMALQQKAALDSRYAALFKKLGLSPAQLDQLKNLLVEKTTATMDVLAATREQGVNPRQDRDTVRKLVSDAEADVDANIRSLLGESGFAQFKDYEKTQPQRAVVSQLEQRLSYSSTPLTAAQSEQIVNILASTQAAQTGGDQPSVFINTGTGLGTVATTFIGRGHASQPVITDAAINQSLGVLAGPQIDALRQLQQEQQAQAELGAAFRRNGPPNPGSQGSASTAPGAAAKSPSAAPAGG